MIFLGGEREHHASIESLAEGLDERAVDRIQLDGFLSVDALIAQLPDESGGVAVRVDGHAWSGLAGAVEPIRGWVADLDPALDGAGEVLHRNRWFVRLGESA